MDDAVNLIKDIRVRRYVRDMVFELSKMSLNNQDISTASCLLDLWNRMTAEDSAASAVDDAA